MGRNHSQYYIKYLQSEAWQQVRLATYHRDDGCCRHCGKPLPLNGFDCHHRHYGHLGKERENGLTSVITLCRQCHEDYHDPPLSLRALEAFVDKFFAAKSRPSPAPAPTINAVLPPLPAENGPPIDEGEIAELDPELFRFEWPEKISAKSS